MKSNREEFLKMLSAYQGMIHKVNQIYLKSKAEKEDNFQEVVYQLWRSFSSLQNKEKPASWIYAVAINTSISKIRKNNHIEFCDTIPDVEAIDPHKQMEQSENCTFICCFLYLMKKK